MIFEKNVFPIGFKIDFVAEILNNCIQNPANQIFPEYIKDIDSIVVDRKLKSIKIR